MKAPFVWVDSDVIGKEASVMFDSYVSYTQELEMCTSTKFTE